MAGDDDHTVIRHGEAMGAEPGHNDPKEKVDGLFKGAEVKEGRVKVLPASVVRERVLKLIEELAAKSCPEHIKEIYELREQNGKDQREIQRLTAEVEKLRTELEERTRERDAALAQLKEMEAALAKQQADHAAELQRVRDAAAGEAQERIVELERLLTMERGRADDLDARLAAAMAEIERLNVELAALKKQLEGDDKRTKAELLKLISELEAKIHELELGLDYFDLEEEFDDAAFQKRAEEVAAHIDPSHTLYKAAREAAAEAATSAKKLEALRIVMNENKAAIAVVVDMVKNVKAAEGARGRLGVVEQSVPS